jgi:hypothetical protein
MLLRRAGLLRLLALVCLSLLVASAISVRAQAPHQLHLPLMVLQAPPPMPALTFVGVNGGPIDGNAAPLSSPTAGDLGYYPELRAKSFDWMNLAGLHWFRNYSSDSILYSWRFTEPARGVYDWSAWDALVQAAQSHHIALLAGIGNGVPAWASGSSDWRVPPSDLYTQPAPASAWYQFVRAFVERYDGDGVNDMPGLTQPVKYWELWNEPDLREAWAAPDFPAHQFGGNLNDAIRLLSVGYAAVKAADPGAQVVGPATAQSPGNSAEWVNGAHWYMWTWTDFVAAGGLNSVDIVSFHHYLPSGNWDASGLADQMLAEAAANRAGKPVWLTESGWVGDPITNYAVKAQGLVRLTVMGWAQPWLQMFFWYDFQEAYVPPVGSNMGLVQTLNGDEAGGIEPDPLFHPAYRAAEIMSRVLGGFNSADHPATLDLGPAARGYRFSAHGRTVEVVWLRATKGTASITLNTGGQTLRAIGLYGQDLGTFAGGSLTVGPDPVYLSSNLAWNPNVGRITGRVHSASLPASGLNGLAGARVNISGPVTASAHTDSDGNYVFSDLPMGRYHVSVNELSTTPSSYDVQVGYTLAWGRASFGVTGTQ